MNNKQILLIVPLVALVVGLWDGTGAIPRFDLRAGNGDHEMGTAFLVGSSTFPKARGEASFRAQKDKVFKIAVEDAAAAANSNIDIFIDGAKVGSFMLDEVGTGNLTFKMLTPNSLTIEAQGSFRVVSPFPPLKNGSLVEIRTAAGLVVVSGTLT